MIKKIAIFILMFLPIGLTYGEVKKIDDTVDPTGSWDLVTHIKYWQNFDPDNKYEKPKTTMFENLKFTQDGKTNHKKYSWSRDLHVLINKEDGIETQHPYFIYEMGADLDLYLFMSSDQNPDENFYVFKKIVRTYKDDINIPFEEDERILGTWTLIAKSDSTFLYEEYKSLQKDKITFYKKGWIRAYLNEKKKQYKWTNWCIIDPNLETASSYEIEEKTEIENGKNETVLYMYVKLKGKEYTKTGLEPKFYHIFKKTAGYKEDKPKKCPFDPRPLGLWVTVGFSNNLAFELSDLRDENFRVFKSLHFKDDQYVIWKVRDFHKELKWDACGIEGDMSETNKSQYFIPLNPTNIPWLAGIGIQFMFYEWKSGDYSYRNKLFYYVLVRQEHLPLFHAKILEQRLKEREELLESKITDEVNNF